MGRIQEAIGEGLFEQKKPEEPEKPPKDEEGFFAKTFTKVKNWVTGIPSLEVETKPEPEERESLFKTDRSDDERGRIAQTIQQVEKERDPTDWGELEEKRPLKPIEQYLKDQGAPLTYLSTAPDRPVLGIPELRQERKEIGEEKFNEKYPQHLSQFIEQELKIEKRMEEGRVNYGGADNVPAEEWLRKGMSFGWAPDLPVEEPETGKQKAIEAAGWMVSAALLRNILSPVIQGLVGRVPGAAKPLAKLTEQATKHPWKIGWPLEILKAGGWGSVIGAVEKADNKKEWASNIGTRAGTYAAFTVISYPVIQLFRPVLYSLGTNKRFMSDPSNRKTLAAKETAYMYDPPKTLWYRHPTDPKIVLKVTEDKIWAVDIRKVAMPKSERAYPIFGRQEVEAFHYDPSLYSKLKGWLKGIEFSHNVTPPPKGAYPGDVPSTDMKKIATLGRETSPPTTKPTTPVLPTITPKGKTPTPGETPPSPTVPESPKDLEPLVKEARKYKSAEEFVKGQGEMQKQADKLKEQFHQTKSGDILRQWKSLQNKIDDNQAIWVEIKNKEALKKQRVSDELIKKKDKTVDLLSNKDIATINEIAKNSDNLDDFLGKMRGSASQYGAYTPKLRQYVRPESVFVGDIKGLDPKTTITVYRGLDVKSVGNKKINKGDFVTTDYQDALQYTDSQSKVVSLRTKLKNLVAEYPDEVDITNPKNPVSYELLYIPDGKIKKVTNTLLSDIYNKTRSQLKAEWDKAQVPLSDVSKAKASGQSFDEWVKGQGVYEDKFVDAVDNTVGAKISPNGIEVDIARFQKEAQHGMPSVRQGVFYLPEKNSPYKKYYSTGKYGYGGGDLIEGRTSFQKPIITEAGTGGVGIRKAYDNILGRGSYEKMRSDVLDKAVNTGYGKRTNPEDVAELLTKYNKGTDYSENYDVAYNIIENSKGGNTLPYAIQENIAGHAVREAGYDGVLSYSKSGGKPRLSEVFDVRTSYYPELGQTDFSYKDFYKDFKPTNSLKTRSQLKAEWDKVNKEVLVHSSVYSGAKPAPKKPTTPKPTPKKPSAPEPTPQEFSKHFEKIKGDLDAINESIIFDKMDIKKEARKAFSYVKNPLPAVKQKAMRVAYGLEPAPPGLNAQAIRIAMIESLKSAGKTVQARALAKELSMQFTKSAQELNIAKLDVATAGQRRIESVLLGEKLERIGKRLPATLDKRTGKPNSPKKRALDKISSETKKASKEVSKTAAKIQKADDLLDSLIC